MPRFVMLILALSTACGGGSPAKMDAAVDAFFSECGEPGDPGNAEGVGKFCTSIGDCDTTADAPLCASLGGGPDFFCTRTCAGSGSDCGSGATCACGSGGTECGCTPNSCLN